MSGRRKSQKTIKKSPEEYRKKGRQFLEERKLKEIEKLRKEVKALEEKKGRTLSDEVLLSLKKRQLELVEEKLK